MGSHFSRRTLLKTGAGAAAAAALGLTTKTSRSFAAPAVLQSTGSTTQVILWSSFASGVNGGAQKKLVDDFNASQKDVMVKLETQDSYEDTAGKLTAALTAGNPPDLATLSDVWWFRFYLSDSIVDLTDVVSAADKADYVDSLFNDYQWNKGQWGLPFARSTPLFYWNQDVFTKAGVETAPKTWSDLAQIAPALVSKGGVPFAFAYSNAADYNAWTLQCMVWAFGGHYSDQDFNILLLKSGCQDAANYVLSSVKAKWAQAVPKAEDTYQAGKVACILASTGSLGGFTKSAQFKVGTAFIPTEKQFGCCTGGTGLSLVDTKNKDRIAAAYKYAQYATSVEKTVEWSQTTGYMPVRKSAVTNASMQAFFQKNPNFKTAVDQLPKTSSQDTARVYLPKGDQYIGAGWDDITINKVDPMKAFTSVVQQLEQERDQEVFPQLKKRQGFLPRQGTPVA